MARRYARLTSPVRKVVRGIGEIIAGIVPVFDYVRLRTTPLGAIPTDAGTMSWNSTDMTVDIILNGATLQVGQETYLRAKNTTGVTIPNGTPVGFAGVQGASGRVLISPYDASTTAPAIYFVGVTTEDFANNDEGFVTVFGSVRGFDTSAWSVGDILWVDPDNAGQFVNVKPDYPSFQISVAAVLTSSIGNGIILVRPNIPEQALTDLVSANVAAGDPTGWEDNTNIGVAYDKTARTITLTHSSGTLTYYYQGAKYQLESPWVSDAHSASDGLYFLYASDGVTFEWSTTLWEFRDVQVAIADLNTTPPRQFAWREVHGLMPQQSHEEFHEQIGTYRNSGLGPTTGTYTLDTATDVATTPGFDAGVIKDEDVKSTIPLSADGTYTTMRIGAGSATTFDTAATFPFRSSGSFPLVNDPSDGSETVATNNRYLNYYEILIPVTTDADSQLYRREILQAQNQYASLAGAQDESFASLGLGDFTLFAKEFVVYSRLTYRTANGNGNTGKVTLAGVSFVDQSRSTVVASGGNPTAENVPTDTTNFTGNLSAADVNVQLALETLDALASSGAIDWANPIAITTATTLTIGKHHVITAATDLAELLPDVSGNAGKLVSWEIAEASVGLVTMSGNDLATTAAQEIDGQISRVQGSKETAIALCNGVTWTKTAGKSIAHYCKMYASGITTIPTATVTIINIDTVEKEVGIIADKVNHKIPIRRAGDYLIIGAVRYSALAADSELFAVLFDDTSVLSRTAGAAFSANSPQTTCPYPDTLAAGSEILIKGYHTSGVDNNALGGEDNCCLTVMEVNLW